MAPRYVANPTRRPSPAPARLNLPRAFHVRLPGYQPTPLVEARELAARLGLARLRIKDESQRCGLPSFELLGAAWAIYRMALDRLGRRPPRWDTVDELRPRLAPVASARVVTVSDNDFGLAVARGARLLGFGAVVFVPGSAAPERLSALANEGATVVTAGASYDDALAAAAAGLADDDLVVSDTSWEGYDEVPGWVTDGYVTAFEELVDEVEARGEALPTCVVVPLGTGALAAAAGSFLRSDRFDPSVILLGAEPVDAACFGESVEAGERVAAPDPAPSILTSLARGLPSPLALTEVMRSFDGFVAITDDDARWAVDALATVGIDATPSGAASLAALRVAADAGALTGRAEPVDAVVVCTEGPLPSAS